VGRATYCDQASRENIEEIPEPTEPDTRQENSGPQPCQNLADRLEVLKSQIRQILKQVKRGQCVREVISIQTIRLLTGVSIVRNELWWLT
jgi:hypothetical protein